MLRIMSATASDVGRSIFFGRPAMKSVSVGPGLTRPTLTPLRLSCSARFFITMFSAALLLR